MATLQLDPNKKITNRQLKSALKDGPASAKVANLIYTSDANEGIMRKKVKDRFIYTFNGKTIKDTETLVRIKSLVIPPAWERVWICADSIGHLQVTGYDVANRKQYRYHPSWNNIRSHTKYYRLLDFGLSLPKIRQKIEQDLSTQGMNKQKILAAILAIIDIAYIRIGNEIYEKLNGSYGLTTLRNKHVKIEGTQIKFHFIGKKGITNNVTIKNRKLSLILRKCREIPGQQLFGYIDNDGSIKKIDSGMVNEYIHEISDNDFTAKDFRTWAGSVSAIKAFKQLGPYTSQAEMKRKINQAYDLVASDLRNTRNVCKNHYIHPLIVNLYEENKLSRYFDVNSSAEIDTLNDGLKDEELILINILSKH